MLGNKQTIYKKRFFYNERTDPLPCKEERTQNEGVKNTVKVNLKLEEKFELEKRVHRLENSV